VVSWTRAVGRVSRRSGKKVGKIASILVLERSFCCLNHYKTSKLARANSAARFDKSYFLKCYVSIVFSLSILIHYPSF
jgi:hypothetical protein